MAFEDDIDADRSSVFLNEDEFAETVTYRVASTGAEKSITAEIEDGPDTIPTDALRARISSADVATPVKGDQITRATGPAYTIVFIEDEMRFWVLELNAEELVQ